MTNFIKGTKRASEEIDKEKVFTNPKKSGFFDLPDHDKKCNHPEHEPPSHICIPTGKGYRHICPSCGKETILIPPQITF